MDRYQEHVERLSAVKGFLVPLMADDPIPGQRRRYALSRDDFEKVCYGAACSECLADFSPLVLVECPVCHHRRQPNDLAADASDWADYLKHRKAQIENPQRTELPGMDEIVTSISEDVLDGWKPGQKKNF